jgi:hypothetical protein
MSLKQEAIDCIAKLPDTANLEDIMYRLYVLGKIKEGKDAVKKGKVIPLEELKREIQAW